MQTTSERNDAVAVSDIRSFLQRKDRSLGDSLLLSSFLSFFFFFFFATSSSRNSCRTVLKKTARYEWNEIKKYDDAEGFGEACGRGWKFAEEERRINP